MESKQGGYREGAGRKPKGDTKRNKVLSIRVTEEELSQIKYKANELGLSLTEYIIQQCK